MEAKHTKEDLKRMQALPLSVQIGITQARIMEWYNHYQGKVYVSFSGGKDSTVLLDLARRMFPDVEAVFCDTGLEFPEIREFVKTKENVKWLYPCEYNKQTKQYEKRSFKQVVDMYGYVYPSKEVALNLWYAKHSITKSQNYINRLNGLNADGTKSEIKQRYKKYAYLLDAPFAFSPMCCKIMKENPLGVYGKETRLKPIIATMASESDRRKQGWLKTGCNAFDKDRPSSQPMAFWAEQDVLQYIKQFNIPYCSVYGDIVEENGRLKTTGEERTGCMFCLVGVHLDNPNRFQRMRLTHPKQYDYCINKLGIGEVLDYIGVPYK